MFIDKQNSVQKKSLSQSKQRLLEKYLEGRAGVDIDSPIEKRPSSFAQLSPTQMRL